MKALVLSAVFAVASGMAATAQDVPRFYSETYPAHALDEALALDGALMGEEAALDGKTRELIGLAVAAQVPCSYCVHYHMRAARAAGASDEEVREAVAMAANVRHWSTVLNGMAYDFDAFRDEVDELVPMN